MSPRMRSRSPSIASGSNFLSVVRKYKSIPFAGSDISCRRRRTCRRDLFGGQPPTGSLASKNLIMKLALIAIGLLATTSQAPPAFARGGLHAEDRWNPQHIDGLPAEVRNTLAHMCGGSRAEHQFAGYFHNSRVLVCISNTSAAVIAVPLCTQAGCLHQVYISTGGRYRLLRSYYAPEGD